MRARAATMNNIDGFVFRNIVNFVHDRQKHYDPLGRRVFELTRQAVGECIASGDLVVLQSDEKLNSHSRLGYPGVSFDEKGEDGQVLELGGETWGDVLLPELVTSRGPAVGQVVKKLQELILSLPSCGIDNFSLGRLVHSIQGVIRQRWRAIAEHEEFGEVGFEGEEPQRVPVIPPDLSIEERDAMHQLTHCVGNKLDALTRYGDSPSKIQEARAIWELLLDWSHGVGIFDSQDGGSLAPERLLSQRRIASFLGLSRRQVKERFDILRQSVQECRGAANPRARSSKGGREGMDDEIKASLRLRTGEHLTKLHDVLGAPPSPVRPEPGHVYVLPATGPLPVEWLVLRRDKGPTAKVLVAAVDDSPFLGIDDLSLTDQLSGAELFVRRGHCASVRCGLFETAVLTRRIGRQQLAEVLTPRENRPANSLDDDDPTYGEWLNEVIQPALQQLEEMDRRLGNDESKTLPFEPGARRRPPVGSRWPQTLAAVFALVSLGLGGLAWHNGQIISDLSDPRSTPASAQILLGDDLRQPDPWRLEDGQQELILDLVLRHPFDCESFNIELLDSDKHPIWAFESLPFSNGKARVVLPRPFLERRPETLRLSGDCADGQQTLQTLPLRLFLDTQGDTSVEPPG